MAAASCASPPSVFVAGSDGSVRAYSIEAAAAVEATGAGAGAVTVEEAGEYAGGGLGEGELISVLEVSASARPNYSTFFFAHYV